MKEYVVVIGASNVDVFANPETERLHDSNIGVITTSLGGVGRNIAENIGLLGIDVQLLSIIGNDTYGEKIIQETSNVQFEHCVRANQNTGVYLSVGKDMIIAVNDMLINDSITEESIQKMHDVIEGALLVVLDTNFSKEVLEYVAHTYQHKTIILDPVSGVKCAKVKAFIGKFHTIKPNIMEAEILADMEIATDNDLKVAGNYFLSKGVREVFITLGERGVYYSNGEDSGIHHVEKLDSVNVTGAGDAFVAGLVYATLHKYNIKEKAVAASKASAVALRSKHTINKELSVKDIEVK